MINIKTLTEADKQRDVKYTKYTPASVEIGRIHRWNDRYILVHFYRTISRRGEQRPITGSIAFAVRPEDLEWL